jgi:ribosomal protein S18 acetylase RimI-like enzyme
MSSRSTPQDITVRRFTELAADSARLLAEIDAIFFESSGTKTFADEATRAAFRERWLGRYLAHDPQWAYVALTAEGTVAGYLLGSIDDPARTQRFSDIAYLQDFAALTADYPAHLHVNLAPQFRGDGLGAALVDAFAADAVHAGAGGMHIVTGAGMRNIGFYERNGFRELGRAAANGHEVLFFGRKL